MTGRNSKPKNTGPAGKPSRLDQFEDKLADSELQPKVKNACDTEE
ncbi:hypothetical protein ACHHV8_23820 [Paenibacillus sp. TAB 01]